MGFTILTIVVVPETEEHLQEKIDRTPTYSFKQRGRIVS